MDRPRAFSRRSRSSNEVRKGKQLTSNATCSAILALNAARPCRIERRAKNAATGSENNSLAKLSCRVSVRISVLCRSTTRGMLTSASKEMLEITGNIRLAASMTFLGTLSPVSTDQPLRTLAPCYGLNTILKAPGCALSRRPKNFPTPAARSAIVTCSSLRGNLK